MGIARFATVYDGKQETAIRHSTASANTKPGFGGTASHARKQKFSQNWKKAKARIQHTHTRIANVRRDFLHKASTTISQNHAMVLSRICRCGTCPSRRWEPARFRAQRRRQSGTEQIHPRPRMGRVPPPARLQTGMAGRRIDPGVTTKHQPDLSGLWACVGSEPHNTSSFLVRCMRLREQCRSSRCNQYFKGGTRPASLWRDFACR